MQLPPSVVGNAPASKATAATACRLCARGSPYSSPVPSWPGANISRRYPEA